MPGLRHWGSRAMGAAVLGLLLAPFSLSAHEGSPAHPRAAAPVFDFDDAPADPFLELEALLLSLADASTYDRLEAVNRFFNRLRQGDDREIWGAEDHWATPSELLARGAGDCEDLAIAKYFTLRRLGVPAAALRVTYARDLRQGSSHMTLLYLSAGRPALILDNEVDRPEPLSARPELVPVYGVNEERITVSVPGGSERSFPHAGRWTLHRWQDIVARARPAGARTAAADALRHIPARILRARLEPHGAY